MQDKRDYLQSLKKRAKRVVKLTFYEDSPQDMQLLSSLRELANENNQIYLAGITKKIVRVSLKQGDNFRLTRQQIAELNGKKSGKTKHNLPHNLNKNSPPPTRTLETEANYIHRAEQLFTSFVTKFATNFKDGSTVTESLKLTKFLEHIASQQQNLKRNTWTQYLAAITIWLEKMFASPTNSDVKVLQIPAAEQQIILDKLAMIKELPLHNCKQISSKTSAMKVKRITAEELKLILNELSLYKKKHDELLYNCIITCLTAGLRPVELMTMKLLTVTTLVVQNAKNSNGRATGVTRKLDLSLIDKDKLQAIERSIEQINIYKEWLDLDNQEPPVQKKQLNKLSRVLADRLNYVGKKVLTPRVAYPSMYTFRHQFRANQAKIGKTKAEIANMMGHSSEKSASLHYAKSNVAHDTFTIAKVVELSDTVGNREHGK